MENEFQKVMSQRTDEELIKIVTVEKEKYNPQAIAAAESEVQKRAIDPTHFEQIREKAAIENEQKEKVSTTVVSSGVRCIHFLIDSFIWVLIAVVVSMLIGLFIPTIDQIIILLISSFVYVGTFIAYYTILEVKFQKTVGKFVTNTKVVTLHGEKPTNGAILTRTFCRLIPFDRISFLFVKNGIHDYLSKTNVIKDTPK